MMMLKVQVIPSCLCRLRLLLQACKSRSTPPEPQNFFRSISAVIYRCDSFGASPAWLIDRLLPHARRRRMPCHAIPVHCTEPASLPWEESEKPRSPIRNLARLTSLGEGSNNLSIQAWHDTHPMLPSVCGDGGVAMASCSPAPPSEGNDDFHS